MNNETIGVVVIGRNEGDRLKRCLASILRQTNKIVYVDSGSTDGTVEHAQALGLRVVQLDLKQPFSAARARNIGFYHIIDVFEMIRYVQFIDGDCELCDGWLSLAAKYIGSNHAAAIVAGRLKECFPEHSIYNRLCDLEWDAPVGEALSCGGIFLVRATAFDQVNGFNRLVIAGEEPELCYRLRQHGWRIYRLGELMAFHDAGMIKFGQWWKRTVRGGYAYAQGCALHGMDCERFRVKECLRIWVWSIGVPIVILLGVSFLSPWLLLLLIIYPVQAFRVFWKRRKITTDNKVALVHAVLTVLDKWPQLWGQVLFLKKWFARQEPTIIEHK